MRNLKLVHLWMHVNMNRDDTLFAVPTWAIY